MKRREKPKTSWRQGREWRQPYRRSRAFDPTCRCNGSCAYCRGNRLYQVRRAEAEARHKERHWLGDLMDEQLTELDMLLGLA